jgi:hypothetical protein
MNAITIIMTTASMNMMTSTSMSAMMMTATTTA